MLFDELGNRKYLTANERSNFITAAEAMTPAVETFCSTLAHTGARISEVLAVTPAHIDFANGTIVVESLKKRRRGIYRAIPVPEELLSRLEKVHGTDVFITPSSRELRLWPWCRTTAWLRVKEVMQTADIRGAAAMPKGLRHAFGVEGVTEARIPLNIIQRWLGHSRIETTVIYTNAVGSEERELARRMWRSGHGRMITRRTDEAREGGPR
jgi:integrase/recombinase XerD